MATTGIKYELTEKDKTHAIKYVQDSGFFKKRLAEFLEISRPTLDKILEEDASFFTSLQRADSLFCKSLIDIVKRKNPAFILKMRYKEEFNENNNLGFDPQEAINKVDHIIKENTSDEIGGNDGDYLE